MWSIKKQARTPLCHSRPMVNLTYCEHGRPGECVKKYRQKPYHKPFHGLWCSPRAVKLLVKGTKAVVNPRFQRHRARQPFTTRVHLQESWRCSWSGTCIGQFQDQVKSHRGPFLVLKMTKSRAHVHENHYGTLDSIARKGKVHDAFHYTWTLSWVMKVLWRPRLPRFFSCQGRHQVEVEGSWN